MESSDSSVSMQPVFITDLGLFRRSKEGVVDAGNDAGIFLTKRRIAALFDGMDEFSGSGDLDCKRFSALLKKVKQDIEGFESAFFDLCGEESCSTVVSLLLPSYYDEKGLLLNAGASYCLRFRDGDLEELTQEHTEWGFFLNSLEPSMSFVRERLKEVLYCSDLDDWDGKLIKDLRTKLKRSLTGKEEPESYQPDFPQSHKEFFSLIHQAKADRYLSLRDTSENVKSYMGNRNELQIEVRSGDRFLLLSNGVYSNSLTRAEIKNILLSTDNARLAARMLVDGAARKNICHDDRVAMVVEIGNTPLSEFAPKKDLYRESLGKNDVSEDVVSSFFGGWWKK